MKSTVIELACLCCVAATTFGCAANRRNFQYSATSPQIVQPYTSNYPLANSTIVGNGVNDYGIINQPPPGVVIAVPQEPPRPTMWGRLVEMEQRKNAWLRRNFLGEN